MVAITSRGYLVKVGLKFSNQAAGERCNKSRQSRMKDGKVGKRDGLDTRRVFYVERCWEDETDQHPCWNFKNLFLFLDPCHDD